jgi:hypothetical protein
VLTLTVLWEEFAQELGAFTGRLDQIVELAAKDLADAAAQEGGEHSKRLGADWPVSGTGPGERHVVAPEWWAHFVAGGTQAHGPARAQKLVFTVDGQQVRASRVSGTPATKFDERAVERSRSNLDDVVRRAIA